MTNIVKKVSGPYKISSTNGSLTQVVIGDTTFLSDDSLTVDGNTTIQGNLVVNGTHTTIHSNDTLIDDNIITLNANLAITEAPTLSAGIEVNRGNQLPAVLRWDEPTLRWQISNGLGNANSVFLNIATTTGSGYLTHIVEDLLPKLGANLDVNGFSIVSDEVITLAPTDAVNIKSELVLGGAVTTSIGSNDPGVGKSGIYVTNTVSSNEELITKSKAVVYSLIF